MTPADFRDYRPLPDATDPPGAGGEAFREMGYAMRDAGAAWMRYTVVSDTYPQPPAPHGLYVEGWRVRPAVQAPLDHTLFVMGTLQ